MSSKFRVVAGALALLPACGGGPAAGAGCAGCAGTAGFAGTAGTGGEDLLFVPQELSNTEVDDAAGGLTLIAFTLVLGEDGPELYAAVRNDGESPSCDAGMMTYFIDRSDELVATAGSVLSSGRLYRLDNGAGVAIPCVAPGQIAMTASPDLPESVVLEELAYLKHAFPAFTVNDIVPIEGLTVSGVETVVVQAGSAYTGTVANGLDVPVTDPTVSVFPVNRVGRPLGMVTVTAATEVPPGGSWTFETSAVIEPGVDFVAYATASLGY